MTISNLCPNLTHLHLDLCGQLNSEAVRTWGKNLKSLERLELNAPFLVRKDGWLDFFPSVGSRLKGFLLTQSPRFNLECLESMVKHCPELTELRLSQIGDMGDTFLGEISNLKHLTLLDISDPSAHSITDGPATELLQSIGPSLRTLNLSTHIDLSDDFPSIIAQHCPRLAHLHLRCLDFSDESIAALFTTMKDLSRPGLSTIDLEKGHMCNGAALRALVAHSGATVEHLNLMGWKDLDEGSMQAELVKCTKLTTLDIGWCRNVTDYVIKDILEKCEAIQRINVWGECFRLVSRC
jgi:DNA repair protein RAD7